MSHKYALRPLADIATRFFVRAQVNVNNEHVLLLKRLYETGAKVPPILVTDDNVMIDGRHRMAALEMLGRTETLCEVVNVESRADAIAMALAANAGGSLPASNNDINHVIRLLLEQRKSTGDVKEVKKNEGEVRLKRAVAALRNDDITIGEAAEKYGVEVSSIRNRIKAPETSNVSNISHVIGGISLRALSFSASMREIARKAIKQREEGLVDDAYVLAILDEMDRYIKLMAQANTERRARMVAQPADIVFKEVKASRARTKPVKIDKEIGAPATIPNDKTIGNGHDSMTPEDFVLQEIVARKKADKHAIHVVFSGLNKDIRARFPDVDPTALVKEMARKGMIGTRVAKRGAIVYLPFNKTS